MTALCNLDGLILPESEARISVLDRGFLFGDSVYEVIKTWRGVPFAWPEHLARLRASADGIQLPISLDDADIMRRVKDTLARVDHDQSYIRIIVTRGEGSEPNIDLAFAPGPETYVILVRPMGPSARSSGHLALVPRLRNDRRALDPAIKSGNYLNNVLGLAEAKAAGATDCLFLNQDGGVTEASTANFYAVIDGTVVTPPLSAGLLAGVTRRLLFALCERTGVLFVERNMTADQVRAADEVFLTSTKANLMPITMLDGKPIGDGEIGALTAQLRRDFEDFGDELVRDRYGPPYAAL